jgi:hypothetical protein
VTRDERKLRAKLEWVKARYDSAQVSDAVFAVVKELETGYFVGPAQCNKSCSQKPRR